jgi:hypothetical protein
MRKCFGGNAPGASDAPITHALLEMASEEFVK